MFNTDRNCLDPWTAGRGRPTRCPYPTGWVGDGGPGGSPDHRRKPLKRGNPDDIHRPAFRRVKPTDLSLTPARRMALRLLPDRGPVRVAGLRVWISEQEFVLGDSPRRHRAARFGYSIMCRCSSAGRDAGARNSEATCALMAPHSRTLPILSVTTDVRTAVAALMWSPYA